MCKRNIDWLSLTYPATQARALTGNQSGNLPVCRPAPDPPHHSSQGCILSVCSTNEMFMYHLALHAFKDGTHHPTESIKSFRINAPKYYDLINPHIVFCVLHISRVSKPDLRK